MYKKLFSLSVISSAILATGTAFASDDFHDVSFTGPVTYGYIMDELSSYEAGKPTIISITGIEGDLYQASAGDWFSYDWPDDGGVDAVKKISFRQTGTGTVTAINLADDDSDSLVFATEVDIDSAWALVGKGRGNIELVNGYNGPEDESAPIVYESILKGGVDFKGGSLKVSGQKVYLLGEGTIGTLTVSSAPQTEINLGTVDVPGTIRLNKDDDNVFGQVKVNTLVFENGTIEIGGMSASQNKQLRGHGAWLLAKNLSTATVVDNSIRKITVTGNGMLALGSVAGKTNDEIGNILADAELKCGTTKPTLVTQGPTVALGGDGSEVCIQIGSSNTNPGIHVGKDGRWIYDVANVRYPNGGLEVSPEEGYELYLLNWDGSEIDLPEAVPSFVASDTFRVKYNANSKTLERVFNKDLPGLKAREIVDEVETLAANDVKAKLGVGGIYLQKLMTGNRVGDDFFGHEVDSGVFLTGATGIPLAIERGVDNIHQTMMGRPLLNPYAGAHLWVAGKMEKRKGDRILSYYDSNDKLDIDSYSLTLGCDFVGDNGLSGTVALSGTSLDTTIKSQLAGIPKGKATVATLSATVQKEEKWGEVRVGASFSQAETESKKQIDLNRALYGAQNRLKTEPKFQYAGLSGQVRFNVEDVFYPFVRVDGYFSHGKKSVIDCTYDDQYGDAFKTSFKDRLWGKATIGATLTNTFTVNDYSFIPVLSVQGTTAFGDRSQEMTARFVGGTQTSKAKFHTTSRNSARVDLSLTLASSGFKENTSLFGEKATEQSPQLKPYAWQLNVEGYYEWQEHGETAKGIGARYRWYF